MATANTYIKVTELDFDQIRSNLKTYLSSQDRFADYNFDGSVMATMLDVLAYNTHYNAYYLNMLANEMFLDTAQQRDSVVSRAKELGYTPLSALGSTANVHLTFTGVANTVAQFTIPKNSKFVTRLDDSTYTFVTTQAHTVTNQSNAFETDIPIREGLPLTYVWTVDTNSPVRYIIPNNTIDTGSIVVTVQESASDTTTTEFTRATNINQIYSDSTVYFLEEATDGRYELVFGNGTLGKAIKNGNIISVSYLACNGDETNGSDDFTADVLSIGQSYTSVSVSTNTKSTGGRNQESISSIKFNAPRDYQTQNRAVVENDYERIVLGENNDIESVVAYGGEQADPAVYGKVYIGVKPYGEQYATDIRKNNLRASILSRTPLGIDPVIIDPVYTYIIPTVTVYYNATRSTTNNAAISAAVKTAIDSYSDTNLERFNNRFRYSRFARSLDNLSIATINNTDASLKMQTRFTPSLGVVQKIIKNFNNPIRELTLESSQFKYLGFDCFLDDLNGIVRIYRYDSNKVKTIVKSNSGTIDYDTGKIELDAFAPTSFVGDEMELTVTPDRLDVIPQLEQILIMDSNDATINVIPEYD